MRLSYIAIVLSTLIFSGCGTIRQPVRHFPVTDNSGSGGGNKILYPKGHDSGSTSSEKDAVRVRDVTFEFSGIETEHVRVAGVNPLPAGGTLVLDLDRMAEEFCYPYRGRFLSDYGPRGNSIHTGVDIKAVPNDTIRAAFPGVVRMSKNYSSYGNIVVIRHYSGFETVYSHNSSNLVKVNDIVEAGTPIGLAGRTGRATTEHLHFETRAAGHPFDPKTIVDCENMSLRTGKVHLTITDGVLYAYRSESELDESLGRDRARREQIAREDAEDAVKAKEQKPAETKNTGNSSPIYYKVKKGDTLSAIARNHGTTVDKLCRLNGIRPTSVLQINQRLRLR